ncbi:MULTISPECIES: hypothetical protein [Protofrankia]|uniref:hypothetical protein n=1 Tax=Protofrankia TaxID=2994361 RepID=UPI0001C53C6F|nr:MULTISPECIES: hypothetical protein [Protofrankia]
MTTTVDYEYHSELFRNIAAQTDREAILTVLDVRGVPAREKIMTCTDLAQLNL